MPLDRPDIERFRHTYLFTALTDEEIDKVAAHARTRECRPGEILFTQGAPCHHFFHVEAGVIKLYRLSPSGEEKVMELIGPNHLFAEAVVFMGGRYPVHAEAVEAARLIAFDSTNFMELLRSNMDLCFRLMSSMSMRMHALINDIDRLTLHSGTERLIQYLLDQLPHDGTAPPSIRLGVPKQVIASRLGVQPETLSRILARLRNEGLLEIHDDTVVLKSLEALRRHG
ncbi:MAG: Crp/Fnr family transcriptional regulator [Betaproteobacteria bacterium]|nr:Crp/Fnr family transcriptional regulator [Betaproteobacteria bacterium]